LEKLKGKWRKYNGSLSRHLNSLSLGELGSAGFIGAKDDESGGDNRNYNSCKAPVKSSPPANQHPGFYRPDALSVTQSTVL